MKKLLSLIMNLVMWVMTLFFAISVIMFFPSLASVLCCLLAVLVVPIKKIQNFWDKIFIKKWVKYIVVILLFIGTSAVSNTELENTPESNDTKIEEGLNTKTESTSTNPIEEEPVISTEPTLPLAFLNGFTEYGYTDEQIEDMREILVNVGITEITDLEITPVSYGMQTVYGVAFRYDDIGWDKEVHVRFSIENGVLYYVHIYCPSYGTKNQPTYLSGLEERRAELYYDTEGGYLKRIDWETKSVVDY